MINKKKNSFYRKLKLDQKTKEVIKFYREIKFKMLQELARKGK